VRMLKPERIIPMHFGTFPPLTGSPAKLQELTPIPVWELTPGKPVRW